MKIITKLDDIYYHTESSDKGTILSILIKNKIDAPYSCQNGYCTICKCKLVSGNIIENGDTFLTDGEKKEGFILSCQSYAKSDEVRIDFDYL